MDSRVKSSIKNTVAMGYNYAVTSVMPFIVRTLIIYRMGIDYVGINSLFGSILAVLSIAELGIDTTMNYVYYRPISEGNVFEINALQRYFRRVYLIIGCMIIALGLACIPFLPVLVHGEYPSDVNVVFVYLVYVVNSAFPFFTFGYRNALYRASKNQYLSSIFNGTSALLMYCLQIIAICFVGNYHLYTSLLLVLPISMYIMILIRFPVDFPTIRPKGELNGYGIKDEIKKNILSSAIMKIRVLSRNSFDSIVISSFLGLSAVARYQNYYMVMWVGFMISGGIRTAVTPNMGNLMVEKDEKTAYKAFLYYVFLQHIIITLVVACMFNLYQPFIAMWVGENNLLPVGIMALFCLYFYVSMTSENTLLIRESVGMWKKGRNVAVIEAVLNLVLNIVLGFFFGISGVLVATVLTILFLNITVDIHYVYKEVFKMNPWSYVALQSKYFIVMILNAALTFLATRHINGVGFISFAFRGALCVIITIICFYTIYRKKEEWLTMRRIIRSIVERVKEDRFV